MTTTTLAAADSRVHPPGVVWRRLSARRPCRRVRPIRAATRGAPCRPLAPRLAIFSVPQGDSEAKNQDSGLTPPRLHSRHRSPAAAAGETLNPEKP